MYKQFIVNLFSVLVIRYRYYYKNSVNEEVVVNVVNNNIIMRELANANVFQIFVIMDLNLIIIYVVVLKYDIY
jgi:hypothetical protein